MLRGRRCGAARTVLQKQVSLKALGLGATGVPPKGFARKRRVGPDGPFRHTVRSDQLITPLSLP